MDQYGRRGPKNARFLNPHQWHVGKFLVLHAEKGLSLNSMISFEVVMSCAKLKM
jgi:hypothetical protein